MEAGGEAFVDVCTKSTAGRVPNPNLSPHPRRFFAFPLAPSPNSSFHFRSDDRVPRDSDALGVISCNALVKWRVARIRIGWVMGGVDESGSVSNIEVMGTVVAAMGLVTGSGVADEVEVAGNGEEVVSVDVGGVVDFEGTAHGTSTDSLTESRAAAMQRSERMLSKSTNIPTVEVNHNTHV